MMEEQDQATCKDELSDYLCISLEGVNWALPAGLNQTVHYQDAISLLLLHPSTEQYFGVGSKGTMPFAV